jgi:hypothetical protein
MNIIIVNQTSFTHWQPPCVTITVSHSFYYKSQSPLLDFCPTSNLMIEGFGNLFSLWRSELVPIIYRQIIRMTVCLLSWTSAIIFFLQTRGKHRMYLESCTSAASLYQPWHSCFSIWMFLFVCLFVFPAHKPYLS